MSSIRLRRQSSNENLYSLHFGQAVAIYDLTRSDADGICSAYKRVFVSKQRDNRRGSAGERLETRRPPDPGPALRWLRRPGAPFG